MMFSPMSWRGGRKGVKYMMQMELQRTSKLSSPSARTNATRLRLGLDHEQEGAACTEGRARSSLLSELNALHQAASAGSEGTELEN